MKRSSNRRIVTIEVVFYGLTTLLIYAAALKTHLLGLFALSLFLIIAAFNRVLLTVAFSRGECPPDDLHPFGYFSKLYFWSFPLTLMMLTAGFMALVLTGIGRLMTAAPPVRWPHAWILSAVVLLILLVAFRSQWKLYRSEPRRSPLFEHVRRLCGSGMVVGFVLHLALLICTCFTLILQLVLFFRNDVVWDGINAIFTGAVMLTISFFIAVELAWLTTRDRAKIGLIHSINTMLEEEETILRIVQLKSLLLGPGNVLIGIKVVFDSRLTPFEITQVINGIEKDVKSNYPEIKNFYIEPDFSRQQRG